MAVTKGLNAQLVKNFEQSIFLASKEKSRKSQTHEIHLPINKNKMIYISHKNKMMCISDDKLFFCSSGLVLSGGLINLVSGFANHTNFIEIDL